MSRVDAHCHLADPRMAPLLDEVLARSREVGLDTFVQGGVDPKDWQAQLDLQQRLQPLGYRIVPTFGLHPYFLAKLAQEPDSSPEQIWQQAEEALDLLAKMAKHAAGLGEMGLDFRPRYLQDSELLQREFLGLQLELAQATGRPVVLHVVRAFDEVLGLWDLWRKSKAEFGVGMVHAFNGTSAQAQAYWQRGLSVSIGGAICDPENRRLQQAVAKLPIEALLLESDSPDQKPLLWPREWNEPTSLLNVAEAIGQIKGLSRDEVLDRTSQNTRKLFSL